MAGDALTAQQERFAQLVVVHGKKLSVAYRKAYDCQDMKPEVVHVKASELAKNGKVTVRIEGLRAMAESKLEVTVEGIARQLARIGFLDLRDCYDDLGRLLAPHEMPEYVAMAIDGIDVVEMEGGAKVGGADGIVHVPMYTKKIRHSRIKALELMAKWRKMLVEQVENGAPGEFSSMDDAQLAAEHTALKEAVAIIERARSRKKVTVKAVKQAKV